MGSDLAVAEPTSAAEVADTTPVVDAETAARARRRSLPARVSPLIAVAVTLVLVAPVVGSLVAQLGGHYRPALDHAWIELRVWDVGGSETPLVGPYTRIGANHPGPLLFYVLAAPYRLLGASSPALLSAAALLNLTSVAGVAAVAYRRGRLPLLLLTAPLTALVLFALGRGFFHDPWNPWMAVLPFLLFLLLTWSVAVGDLPLLPVLAFVGSFLVQTHLGYAVLVAYLGLWALIGLSLSTGARWSRLAPDERRRFQKRIVRSLVITVAVVLVVWAAPIVDQATGDPGNVTALLDSLEGNENAPVGYDRAGGYLGRELAVVGPWSGADGEADGVGRVVPNGLVSLVVPGLALAVGIGLAWRARARDAFFLQVTVLVAVFAAFLATAMIDGTVHTYLIRWTWPIAAVLWLSVAWAAVLAIERAAPRQAATRRYRVGVAAALAASVVVLSWATIAEDPVEAQPGQPWSEQIQGVEGDVLAALEALGEPEPVFVFSGDGDLDSYAVAVGLQLQLEKRGIDIIDPTGDVSRYGRRRTEPDRRSAANLLVVADESIALLRQSPELDFVTSWNPRSPAQQAELTELTRRAESQRLTPEEEVRRRQLEALGKRIGVFVDPSPSSGG
jgi:hypothetical protein